MAIEVLRAANGRIRICTNSWFETVKIDWTLKRKYGLVVVDATKVSSPDQKIYPTLGKNEVVIYRGWDIYFGYDFLADNAESDVFLKRFLASHLPNVQLGSGI